MSDLVQTAQSVATAIAPIALGALVLAAVTKRRALVAAVQRSRREFATNVGLFLVNYLLLASFFGIVAGIGGALVPTHPALTAFWEAAWQPLTVVVAVYAIDFVAYWRHRAEHSPSLWPIHATHHSDEALHWLSVTRKHPLARMFSLFVDNALAIAMGLPLWAIVAGNLIRSWWGYFCHADVPWTLGIFGKVMMSPAAHRLHHIRDEELMGTNYANTVTLWDHLFGTWCDPRPHLNCETGIAGGTRGMIGELARPFEAIAAKFAEPADEDPAPAKEA